MSTGEASARPDYGIDAPPVIAGLAGGGGAAVIAGLALRAWDLPVIGWSAIVVGAILAVEAAMMLLYARVGKFRHRDRMLAMIAWRGDEQVLDIGTGRGLLMIGAAKRLSTGRATGTDIWIAADLSGNSIEGTRRNIAVEGVAGHCALISDPAQALSSPDASFDVVLSNLCLHNIKAAQERDAACREIARVLKPGGRALISDMLHTGEYAQAFRAAGLRAEVKGPYLDVFPPLRIVVSEKV
jgi:arsenite methyltransferase